jgi:hypothetical protein
MVYHSDDYKGGYETQKEEQLFTSCHRQHLNSGVLISVVISAR